jgi:hypothetical protein
MYLQFPDYVGGHDLADEYLASGDPGADDDDEDGNPNRGASVGYDWHLGGWMGGGKCNDDCAKAFDGICSDPDSPHYDAADTAANFGPWPKENLCAAGTDCFDCGGTPSSPANLNPHVGIPMLIHPAPADTSTMSPEEKRAMWTNIGNETHPMMVPQWGPLAPEKYDHNYPMAHGSNYPNLDSRAGKFLTGPGWDDKRAVPAPRGGTSHIVGDYEFGSGNGMYATTGVSEHKNSEYTWTDSVFFAKDVGVGPEAAGEAEHEYGSGWPMGNSAGPYPSKEWSRSNDGNWVRGVGTGSFHEHISPDDELGSGAYGPGAIESDFDNHEYLPHTLSADKESSVVFHDAAEPLAFSPMIGGRQRIVDGVWDFDVGGVASRIDLAAQGHFWGREYCLLISGAASGGSVTATGGHCDPATDRVGTPCGSGKWGSGFCFQEATRGLMCGKKYAIDDEYNEHGKIVIPAKAPCSMGAIASPNAQAESKRLLTGGCKAYWKSTVDDTYYPDGHFMPGAEIHVPYMCKTPYYSKWLKTPSSTWEPVTVGCMFPGATNFDAAANAIGVHCHWRTIGCTKSEALNYNPEATIDIPAGKDGACILPTFGCTIGSASSDAFIGIGSDALQAAGGWSNSPTNRDMYIGIPGIVQKEAEGNAPVYADYFEGGNGLTNGGADPGNMNPNAANPAEGPTPYKLGGTWDTPMLNYNPAANTLAALGSAEACEVKIEGCMTEGSVNYDPTANVNTNSWCIPKVEGCMLPPKGFANYKADAVFETTAHTFDGFGDVAKYGLSESKFGIITSMKMEDCVLRTSEVGGVEVPLTTFRCGCTDTDAANYDPYATTEACSDGTTFKCYKETEGCLNPAALNYGCSSPSTFTRCTESPRVTTHVPEKCQFYPSAPPSPPPPPPGECDEGVNCNSGFFTVVETQLSDPVCDHNAADQSDCKPKMKAFGEAVKDKMNSDASARRRLADGPVIAVKVAFKGEEFVDPAAAALEGVTIAPGAAGKKSYVYEFEILFKEEAAAKNFVANSDDILGADTWQEILDELPGYDGTILALSTPTPPVAGKVIFPMPAPPPAPPPSAPEVPLGAIIGGSVGGVAVLVIVVVVVLLVKKRKAAPTTPAYS